jgi:branched-chain amino acid transport system permease protein
MSAESEAKPNPAPAAGPRAGERQQRLLVGVIVLVAACALPFLVSSYHVFQLSMALVFSMALLGLNLLTGFNGQISLGHGAFYAIGAYSAAILMEQAGFPYWVTIPIAGAVCLVLGILFGLPALRLEGVYLALATFALAVVLPQLLKFHGVEQFTGGSEGIVIVKPDAPEWSSLSQDQWLYFFTLAWVLVLFCVARNLLRGRVGRALIAIRDNPVAAEAMGINLAFFKTCTFGISAMFTGVAGALGAIVVQFVAPDSFGFFLSIIFLVGVVVGGLGSIAGAFFGALFIEFVPNVTDQLSKSAPGAIYGVFLILLMYLMPFGVAGLVRILMARLRERRAQSRHAQ